MRNSANRWYLYRIIDMCWATVQLECKETGESTILKPCISRLYFLKTLHKTTGLVTFRGKSSKFLSQSVTLWQGLWQNRVLLSERETSWVISQLAETDRGRIKFQRVIEEILSFGEFELVWPSFSYFPMQQDMNFPKLFLHTITIIDYQ